MAQEPRDLVLEHLRRIDGKIDLVSERVGRVETRLRAIEGHLVSLLHSESGQNVEIDRINDRLERIERRLELSKTPE